MDFLFFVIQSTILICSLLVIRKFCKKIISPKLMYLLWIIPMLRLMIPFGLVSFGSDNDFQKVVTYPYAITQEIISPMQEVTISDSTSSNTLNQINGNLAGKDLNGNVNILHFIPTIFFAIWFVGLLILASKVFINNIKISRKIKHLPKLLFSESEVSNKYALTIYESSVAASPCLFGVVKPCILINSKTYMDENLFKYAIMHENMHYQHKDHIWTFLRIAMTVVYWWNPIVWIAAAKCQEDAEYACDYNLIVKMDTLNIREYGKALIQLVECSQPRKNVIYCSTSMASNRQSLKKRIEKIAVPIQTKKIYTFVVVAILFIIGISGFFKLNVQGKLMDATSNAVNNIIKTENQTNATTPSLMDEVKWSDYKIQVGNNVITLSDTIGSLANKYGYSINTPILNDETLVTNASKIVVMTDKDSNSFNMYVKNFLDNPTITLDTKFRNLDFTDASNITNFKNIVLPGGLVASDVTYATLESKWGKPNHTWDINMPDLNIIHYTWSTDNFQTQYEITFNSSGKICEIIIAH